MSTHPIDAASPGLHTLGLKLRAMVLADDSNMAHDADLLRPGQLPNDAVTSASDTTTCRLLTMYSEFQAAMRVCASVYPSFASLAVNYGGDGLGPIGQQPGLPAKGINQLN